MAGEMRKRDRKMKGKRNMEQNKNKAQRGVQRCAKAWRELDFFKKMTWIMVAFCAVVAILFVISTCSAMAGRGRDNREDRKSGNLINVSVRTVRPETFSQTLVLNAELSSLNGTVSVVSPVAGTLVENRVRLGDRVVKGDELGIVDASDIGMSYNSAPVIAKCDGTITSVGAFVGQKVSQANVLYVIEPNPEFVLRAFVSEADADSLHLGAMGRFTTAGDRRSVHFARLRYVAPSVDTTSRTVAIELDVDKADENLKGLRSGNFVELELVKSEMENAIVLPKEAVRSYAGEDVAYIVDSDGVARRVAVSLGLSSQSQVVVSSGLFEGDRVVIQGSPQDGDKVQIL